MKTFVIINGKSLRQIESKNISEARTVAINTSDHSKEIIVREVGHVPSRFVFSWVEDGEIYHKIHTITEIEDLANEDNPFEYILSLSDLTDVLDAMLVGETLTHQFHRDIPDIKGIATRIS